MNSPETLEEHDNQHTQISHTTHIELSEIHKETVGLIARTEKQSHSEEVIPKPQSKTYWFKPNLDAFKVLIFLLIFIEAFAIGEGYRLLKNAHKSAVIISSYLTLDPIMDIKIVSIDEGCPEDYTKATLYDWYGFTDPQAKKSKRKQLPDPYHISNWHKNSFCIQRAKKGDYVLAEHCNQEQQQCYPGYCFLDSKECPLASIEIAMHEVTDDLTKYSIPKIIKISRAPENAPIVDVAVSFYDVPCFDHSRNPLGTLASDFSDMANPAQGCGHYGSDPYFVQALDGKVKDIFANDPTLSPLAKNKKVADFFESRAVLGYRRVPAYDENIDYWPKVEDFERFDEFVENTAYNGKLICLANLLTFFAIIYLLESLRKTCKSSGFVTVALCGLLPMVGYCTYLAIMWLIYYNHTKTALVQQFQILNTDEILGVSYGNKKAIGQNFYETFDSRIMLFDQFSILVPGLNFLYIIGCLRIEKMFKN